MFECTGARQTCRLQLAGKSLDSSFGFGSLTVRTGINISRHWLLSHSAFPADISRRNSEQVPRLNRITRESSHVPVVANP